jgi:hypothetical protein
MARRASRARGGRVLGVDVDEVRFMRHAGSVALPTIARIVANGARGDVAHAVRLLPVRPVGDSERGGTHSRRGRSPRVAQVARHIARGRMAGDATVHVVRPHPCRGSPMRHCGVAVGAWSASGAGGVIHSDAIGLDRPPQLGLMTCDAARIWYSGCIAGGLVPEPRERVKRLLQGELDPAHRSLRHVTGLARHIRVRRGVCRLRECGAGMAGGARPRVDRVRGTKGDDANSDQRQHAEKKSPASLLRASDSHSSAARGPEPEALSDDVLRACRLLCPRSHLPEQFASSASEPTDACM